MPLPRPASPRVLMRDLRAFAAQRSRHQWIALFMAIAMPSIILFVFVLDGKTNIMPGEQVIFVDSWNGSRTDEEVKADQALRQREREKAAAERQREWQELGNRLGM